jgi:SAM-dependent methyltransferase
MVGATARRGIARLIGKAGSGATQISRRLAATDGMDLTGDRWIEWSFCMARLDQGPASTLDFGAGTGFLALAAAQRGHRVLALDRMAADPGFEHESIEWLQADILDDPLEGRRFEQIINCSSIEHVGLRGRYGSDDVPDGDLAAMAIMRELLAQGGAMLLTVPVGEDGVFPPLHRVYGSARLPRLLSGFNVREEQYWHKKPRRGWSRTDAETALATHGSGSFYSLGLFSLSTGQ